jgi:cysteine synthase
MPAARPHHGAGNPGDFADTPIDVVITGVGTGGHLTGLPRR